MSPVSHRRYRVLILQSIGWEIELDARSFMAAENLAVEMFQSDLSRFTETSSTFEPIDSEGVEP